VIVGGNQPRPVVAHVIEVGAVENMRKALGCGNFCQLGVQRCFAMKTPVGWVRSIIRFAEFVGDDDTVCNAPILADFFDKAKSVRFKLAEPEVTASARSPRT